LIQKVGKFELRKVLGKGTSGTVYHALDTFSGQDVALKLLDPQVVQESEEGNANLRQFLNEASLAGKLKHPHIVTILDAVVQEDSGYIAMEIVNGGELSRHAKPETLLPAVDVLQNAPSNATTLSRVTSFSAAFTDCAGLHAPSSTSSSIFLPRTPPFAFMSSTIILTVLT